MNVNIEFYDTCPKPEFIVTGLARSMTAWASLFLSCNGIDCIHEPECIEDSIQNTGKIAYSSSGFIASGYIHKYKNTRIAVIERDPDEAFDSFKNLFGSDIEQHRVNFISMLGKLRMEEIEQELNCMKFSFAKLASGNIQEVKNLFYFCHGTDFEFNELRARNFLSMNIQAKSIFILRDY